MLKRGTYIWLALLVLALVFNILYYMYPRGPQRADIPYSTFRDQVAAGNVTEITTTGQTIAGAFKEPVTWPSSGDNQASYAEFTTHMPPFQDQELLPLLQQKGVVINAKQEGGSWISDLLINMLPLLFFIGLMAQAKDNVQ